MKTWKQALSLLLVFALLCAFQGARAEEEPDFTFLLRVQKCDEASRTVLEGEIDEAAPGDLVAVTVLLRSNLPDSYRINTFQAYVRYEADRVALFRNPPAPGEETPQEPDLWEDGYALLSSRILRGSFTFGNSATEDQEAGAAPNQAAAVFAQQSPVIAPAGAEVPMVQILFRVSENAAGTTAFSFNEEGVHHLVGTYTTGSSGREQSAASLDVSEVKPLTITGEVTSPPLAYTIEGISTEGPVSVEITNNTGSGGVLVAAVYDSQGQMVRCAAEEIGVTQIAQNERASISLDLQAGTEEQVRAAVVSAVTWQPISAQRTA